LEAFADNASAMRGTDSSSLSDDLKIRGRLKSWIMYAILLRRLHWLRAPLRISFKLAVMVYKCIRGLGPAYLADALQPVARIPGRQRLRSPSTSALDVPSTRLSTVGDRAFPVAAARA